MEDEIFEAIYLYQICNSKAIELVQISMLTSSDSFYRGFFENYKGPGTSFQATIFIEFFDKKFYFVILHELAKFHYQTVFTSQVIQ